MSRSRRRAPRLVLLVAVVALVCFAADALLRRALISGLESATGAKMEIGRLDGPLMLGEITLRDVTLADPAEPTQDLLAIDAVSLDLDAGALLRRNLVADAACVTGLRVGTPRDSLGALPDMRVDEAKGAARSRLPQFDERGFVEGAEALWGEIERESESLRLVRGLAERWLGQIEQVGSRALALAQRAAAVQHALEHDENVLRRRESLRRAVGELQSIRRETEHLNGDLRRLGREALAARQAVGWATARDQQRLAGSFRLDALCPEMLSEYLLGPEVERLVHALVAWVRWGRKLWDGQPSMSLPARGIETAPGDPDAVPGFLVRGATLSGQGVLLGRTVQFQGAAWGITSHPKRHGGPTLVDVQTSGGVEMRIRAGVDHTGPVARQRIVIDCPRLDQNRLTLGNPEQLCLAASPGTMRLGVLLDIQGDALFGRLTMEQDSALVDAALGPDYTNPRLERRLQAALPGIEGISAKVQLRGTLEAPRWRLQTELGPRLASAVHRALREELETCRAELAARLEARVHEQLATYEQLLVAKRHEVAEQLRLGDAQVRRIRQLVARRGGLPTRGARIR